jgi:hypothetical protein
MRTIHTRNRLLAVFGALALAAGLALVGAAPPASAHDSVLSTAPADTQHVDLAPETVSMRFTDDIMQLGAIVLVVDSAGTDWAEGEPVLDGPTATLAVDPALPDGAYQVRWRVVSADGHPISGTFDFTVGDADAPPPATADATGEATGEAAAPAVTTPTDSASDGSVTADPTAATAGGLSIGVIALIGAIVGLGVFFGVVALSRRHAASASPPPAGDTEHPPSRTTTETDTP